jgi:3-oxoacyl-[acyl-carrier protein] reductase
MIFEGKVALIVGGGRGNGAATAKLLAARGACVVVNYLQNEATASQVVDQIHVLLEQGASMDTRSDL